MDPWFVVAIVLAVVAVGLGVLATRRRAALTKVQRALGVADGDDPVVAAATLRSELERARADGQAARAALDGVLTIVGPGVVRVDGGLHVTLANAAATGMLRGAATAGGVPSTTASELTGRTVMEVFLDPAVEGATRTAIATGSATQEFRPGGADGPTLAVRIHRAPDGGAWLLLDDVSELRRLQRIRTEFIDNLSHELRTPLTTVSLLAETLARDVEAAVAANAPVTARMRDRLGKIQLETAHLTQMVTEMLELSRIEAGGRPERGRLDAVDMARVATVATERLRTFAERSGVRLAVELGDARLPAVRGDEDRLGQVLLNLLHNAVKFSPSGSLVVVRVDAVGTDVVTSVIDHGPGIPIDAQARIFERFYKVDRARARGEGGTGLGLAISRHIVEAHGGRIWVDSTEGAGSTFSVAIPAAVDAREPVAMAAGS